MFPVLVQTVHVKAQTAVATPYPDPSAAAGMTAGMPNGLTAQQIEMMQVRTEAQSAQGSAVAASMARSVDQTIENQNRERTLQSAREIKAIKRSMAERLKWERANSTQVNKVSSEDMSAWNTSTGNVRVERNVPDPFLASLIEEEQRAMERGTLEKPKKGFKPLKSTAAVLASPFQMFSGGNDDYVEPSPQAVPLAAPSESDGGGGFFSGLKFPKIGGRSEPADIPNPATAEPLFVASPSNSPTPVPQEAVASTASSTGVVPRISGAELVNESSSPSQQTAVNSPNPYAAAPSTIAPEPLPGEAAEKTGFFARMKSDTPASTSSGGGGGFFGFGKKKNSSPAAPGIDASLFPEGAVAQSPTGASLGGGYTAQDVVEESQMVPSSTGNIDLPGETSKKKRSGFSIPKPNLSIPALGGGNASSASTVPTLTTMNSSGNDYYVLTGTAQFMVYGEDQSQSEVRALPAGSVVRMTKPGDQWASIQLPNGSSGIVQNKFLRGASGSEAGRQFAPSN
ncbi:MAG: hypothetical protein P1U58_09895 [Verrucomicrobiales bacterium]|nr:hypothetical protein [Verrucomicrobiales bacterium]